MNSASGGAAARSSRQQSVYHLMIYLHGDVFPKCPLQEKFENKCLCPILNCIWDCTYITFLVGRGVGVGCPMEYGPAHGV